MLAATPNTTAFILQSGANQGAIAANIETGLYQDFFVFGLGLGYTPKIDYSEENIVQINFKLGLKLYQTKIISQKLEVSALFCLLYNPFPPAFIFLDDKYPEGYSNSPKTCAGPYVKPS